MTQAKITFILIVFLGSSVCFSQSSKEISELRGSIHHQHKDFRELTEGNKNEIQLLFSGLFLFYKTFISSQDNSSCSFSPSCSEYGIISVKKKGVLKGMLMTFDRLTRCNGLNRKNYPIDPANGLLIDPV